MKNSGFSAAQIISMIKEPAAGLPRAKVFRKHGLAQSTFYKLKARDCGMKVSDSARLKALENENARLTRLLADKMPDNVVLKVLPGKS